MKDEFNEKEKSSSLDEELDNDSTNEVEYEENDNWKFDGEAHTLNDNIILENGEIEIMIPEKETIVQPTVVNSVVAPAPVKPARKNKVGTIMMTVVLVIAIAVMSVISGVVMSIPNADEKMSIGNTAMIVGSTKVSIGMYNYYYTCVSQNFIQGAQYGYYPDLDPSADFSTQKTTDEDGNEVTWAQRFKDETVEQIKFITHYYEEGVNNGLTLSSEKKDAIDEQLSSLKTQADEANQTVDEYIAEQYGQYCGYATLEKMMEQYYIAQDYYTQKLVTVKATDEEKKAYFDKHKDDYLSVPFAYLQVIYDGETTTKDQAETKAKEYASKIKNLDDLKKVLPEASDDIITQYVAAGYVADKQEAIDMLTENVETTMTKGDESFSVDGSNWLFSKDTKVNDCATFTNEDYSCVLVVLKTGEATLNEDEVYSVRHLLIMPKDDDGNELEDPSQATDEQKAKAKQEAESILAEYKKGEQTEVAFAKLADEKSEDVNSTSRGQGGVYGGLYDGTQLGQMVKNFENWATDKSRKYGDVGIVESKYGYHIMYFIEDTTTYMYNCGRAVVDEKENEELKEVLVHENSFAMKKTKVAEPQQASQSSDDSGDMDY